MWDLSHWGKKAYVRNGSRLCENAGGDTCRATLESKTRQRRFIVAAQAFFLNQCFVSAAEN